ncbi:MAG: MBL fold metallo-hydrolase [Candidatus Aureabacteria bacterium]|nr:MBL fold metallo-hydrolase [Candidatus Auribacterota bacterium]
MKTESKIIVFLSAICAAIWILAFSSGALNNSVSVKNISSFKSRGLLEIHFLDVGQGNSTVIITPKGKILVYDGGKSGSAYSPFDAGEKVVVPFLKKRGVEEIDVIVCSSPDDDHVGGLSKLYNNFKVKQTYDTCHAHPTESYREFLEAVESSKSKFSVIREGLLIKIDENILIQALWPPEPLFIASSLSNNNSAVLKITYGNTTFLLTGDIEKPAETKLLKYATGLKSDVYLAPHHGSRTSSTPSFFKTCSPEIIVISCGYKDKFKHPHPEVLERFEKSGAKIYRTDYNGTVSLYSNGEKIEILTEK